MPIESTVTRRTLLVAGAGGAGAAVLAGCSSSGSGRSGGSGGSGGSQAQRTSQPAHSAAQSAGVTLATLTDLRVGHAVAVKLPGGKPGLLARTTRTHVVCFSAICTHEGCTVAPDGAKLSCPCHGSQFDAASGDVLAGPAPSPLARIAVHVAGGKVVTS